MGAEIACSVNGVPIRLTEERWRHIVTKRPYMASYRDACLETIERPDLVLRGYRGAFVAVRGYGRKCYLCVVYREVSPTDGFVITAYFQTRIDRRRAVWRP